MPRSTAANRSGAELRPLTYMWSRSRSNKADRQGHSTRCLGCHSFEMRHWTVEQGSVRGGRQAYGPDKPTYSLNSLDYVVVRHEMSKDGRHMSLERQTLVSGRATFGPSLRRTLGRLEEVSWSGANQASEVAGLRSIDRNQSRAECRSSTPFRHRSDDAFASRASAIARSIIG